MSEKHWEPTENGGIGTMLSGEKRFFKTEAAYNSAYKVEEDEMADEMARLDEHMKMLAEGFKMDEWLRYA